MEQTNEEVSHLAELVLTAAELLASERYADALRAILLAQVSADLASRHIVDAARVAGATWQDIGNVLGVSRQSAEQRFGIGSRRNLGKKVTPEHDWSATTAAAAAEPGTFTCHMCGKVQYLLDLVLDMPAGVQVCGDCA